MTHRDLLHRVNDLETLAQSMGPQNTAQREILRAKAEEIREEVRPETLVRNWGLGGVAAGAVLPLVGWITGGVAGAAYGAYRSQNGDVAEARQRLDELLRRL